MDFGLALNAAPKIKICQNVPSLKECSTRNCTKPHQLVWCNWDEISEIIMPSIYTTIEINAPRQKVWQALVRKEAWKYWNTFLYDCDVQQPFKQGREVWLSLRRVPGDEETEFQPLVTLIQPGVCLRWVASIPGFVNEHVFELQSIGLDRTQYIHQENFSGILTRVILPFVRQDELQGIRRMARELKNYVESSVVDSRR